MKGTRSLEKAVNILHIVSEVGPVSISDLSRRAEMPKTTVHRIISCLHEEGILQRTPSGYDIAPFQSREKALSDIVRDTATPHLLEFYIATTIPIGLAIQKSGTTRFLNLLYTARQRTAAQEFTESGAPVAEATKSILESHGHFTRGGAGSVSGKSSLPIVQRGVARVRGIRGTGIAVPVVIARHQLVASVSVTVPLAQHASDDRIEHLLRVTSHNVRHALTEPHSPVARKQCGFWVVGGVSPPGWSPTGPKPSGPPSGPGDPDRRP
ncbi:helix-turn-helix domain-containing protein [Streptomyces sp. SID8352]|uniref:helix-turn-helix domain-containing protein n=1 Tax=Streptomyces sp. SID8352 TaxID=2690338 RepID=UPI001F00DE2C|nr:helix-turn-helix domain-containing protein [Streptomyces sp. SID8352]